MKLHLYSDLNLRYFQHTEAVDAVVPEGTDIVVVAGNISSDIKRSLLFQETLSSNHKPIVLNLGMLEASGCVWYDTINAMQIRYATKTEFNCHYSARGNVLLDGLDILAYAGWAPFKSQEDYAKSKVRNLLTEVKHGVRRDENNAIIGYVERRFENSFDNYNAFAAEEFSRVEKWLAVDHGLPKLLVTGADPRELLAGIDLGGVTICSTGSEYYDREFQGGRIICNPGSGLEARGRLFDI